MIKYIIGILLISFKFVGFTQVTAGDCSDAINICSDAGFTVDPNGFGNVDELGNGFSTGIVSNPSTNPNIVAALGTPNSGCLLSGELNSTWMLVNIASNGALEFSFGADGGNNCYDWIMWQYSPTACTDITGDLLPPVACNWNGFCESFTGMAGGPNGSALPTGGESSNFEDALNVLCGEQYLICFSNYSSAATNVPLNFFGTATIDCGIFNPISVNDTTICEGVCVTLTAQGGTSYTWDASPDLSATTGAAVDACPNGAGTFDYYVTGAGLCGPGVDTATVTVIPLGDPTITGPTNVNPSSPPFALNVGTAGGTWTSNCGACFNSTTGMFDPSVAGLGVWEVCYELGVVPCDTMDCIDIVVGCIDPDVDPIAAITECDTYTLPGITGTNLTGNEAFFTGTGGTGTQYNPGDVITSSINLFIYDALVGTTCFDEEAGFNITIVNSPNAGADNDTVICATAVAFDLNTLLLGADQGGVWAETTASGQFNNATGVFDPNGLPGNTFTFT
ncbi:MAG: hypothetical protein MK066_09010 [Crocinitomicaceae bacterium]|nr:hypothetical protein [Crocinitomicaceae bacterium]